MPIELIELSRHPKRGEKMKAKFMLMCMLMLIVMLGFAATANA